MKLVLIPSDYEAAPLLKKLKKRRSEGFDSGLILHKGFLEEKPLAVGIIGMGMPHCASRAAEAMERVKPELAILAGFCGALAETMERGDIFLTTTPDDDHPTPWMHTGLYTSSKPVSTPQEKSELYKETGEDCVDMEQAFAEAVAKERGIPFIGVRIVSDAADEEIPSEILKYGYDADEGKTTPLKMARYLLSHPHQISALVNFLKPLDPIRQKLADELAEFLTKTD